MQYSNSQTWKITVLPVLKYWDSFLQLGLDSQTAFGFVPSRVCNAEYLNDCTERCLASHYKSSLAERLSEQL